MSFLSCQKATGRSYKKSVIGLISVEKAIYPKYPQRGHLKILNECLERIRLCINNQGDDLLIKEY